MKDTYRRTAHATSRAPEGHRGATPAAPISTVDVVSAMVGAALLVLTEPWRATSTHVLLLAFGWALVLALLLRACLKRGSAMLAMVAVLVGTAYSPAFSEQLSQGAAKTGIPVTASSVTYAALALLVFLCVSILSGLAVHRIVLRRVSRVLSDFHQVRSMVALVCLWVVFAATLVAAFETGFWTYYGPVERSARSGGVRLELHYLDMLFVTFTLTATALIASTGGWRRLVAGAVAVMLTVLLFMLQQRRLMMACALVALFTSVVSGRLTLSGRSTRRWFAAAGLAVALTAALFASETWRKQVTSDSAVSMLTETVTKFGSAPTVSEEELRSRLTYLWIDGVAVEYKDRVPPLSLVDALVGDVAAQTPALVFPDKYSVPYVSCETPLRSLGLAVDLPCTAVSEAYLSMGALGVLCLALIWGVWLGLACALAQHGSIAWQAVGILLLVSATTIEAGAFPMIAGIRAALMIGVPVVMVSHLGGVMLRNAANDALEPKPRKLSQPLARKALR